MSEQLIKFDRPVLKLEKEVLAQLQQQNSRAYDALMESDRQLEFAISLLRTKDEKIENLVSAGNGLMQQHERQLQRSEELQELNSELERELAESQAMCGSLQTAVNMKTEHISALEGELGVFKATNNDKEKGSYPYTSLTNERNGNQSNVPNGEEEGVAVGLNPKEAALDRELQVTIERGLELEDALDQATVTMKRMERTNKLLQETVDERSKDNQKLREYISLMEKREATDKDTLQRVAAVFTSLRIPKEALHKSAPTSITSMENLLEYVRALGPYIQDLRRKTVGDAVAVSSGKQRNTAGTTPHSSKNTGGAVSKVVSPLRNVDGDEEQIVMEDIATPPPQTSVQAQAAEDRNFAQHILTIKFQKEADEWKKKAISYEMELRSLQRSMRSPSTRTTRKSSRSPSRNLSTTGEERVDGNGVLVPLETGDHAGRSSIGNKNAHQEQQRKIQAIDRSFREMTLDQQVLQLRQENRRLEEENQQLRVGNRKGATSWPPFSVPHPPPSKPVPTTPIEEPKFAMLAPVAATQLSSPKMAGSSMSKALSSPMKEPTQYRAHGVQTATPVPDSTRATIGTTATGTTTEAHATRSAGIGTEHHYVHTEGTMTESKGRANQGVTAHPEQVDVLSETDFPMAVTREDGQQTAGHIFADDDIQARDEKIFELEEDNRKLRQALLELKDQTELWQSALEEFRNSTQQGHSGETSEVSSITPPVATVSQGTMPMRSSDVKEKAPRSHSRSPGPPQAARHHQDEQEELIRLKRALLECKETTEAHQERCTALLESNEQLRMELAVLQESHSSEQERLQETIRTLRSDLRQTEHNRAQLEERVQSQQREAERESRRLIKHADDRGAMYKEMELENEKLRILLEESRRDAMSAQQELDEVHEKTKIYASQLLDRLDKMENGHLRMYRYITRTQQDIIKLEHFCDSAGNTLGAWFARVFGDLLAILRGPIQELISFFSHPEQRAIILGLDNDLNNTTYNAKGASSQLQPSSQGLFATPFGLPPDRLAPTFQGGGASGGAGGYGTDSDIPRSSPGGGMSKGLSPFEKHRQAFREALREVQKEERTMTQATSQLREMTERASALDEELRNTKANCDMFEKKAQSLAEEIEYLRTTKAQTEKQIRDHSREKLKFEDEISTLSLQVDTIKAQLARSDTRSRSLADTLSSLEEDGKKTAAELLESRKQLKELEQKMSSIEYETRKPLDKQIEELKKKETELTATVKQLAGQMDSSQGKRTDQMRGLEEENNRLMDKIHGLEYLVSQKEVRITKLQDQMAETRTELADIQRELDEVSKANAALEHSPQQKKQQVVDALRQQLDDCNREILQLREINQTMHESFESDSFRKKYHRKKNHVSELKAQISSLQKELLEMTRERDDLKESVAVSSVELGAFKTQNTMLEARLQAAESETDSLKRKLMGFLRS